MEFPSQEATSELVKQMTKHERLGQHVLQNKKELLIYEEKREKCREAMRAIEKNRTKQGKKSWFCVSETTFLKFPTEDVEEDLRGEQKFIREKYVETQEEMKQKVHELKQMEGARDLEQRGFLLQAMTKQI